MKIILFLIMLNFHTSAAIAGYQEYVQYASDTVSDIVKRSGMIEIPAYIYEYQNTFMGLLMGIASTYVQNQRASLPNSRPPLGSLIHIGLPTCILLAKSYFDNRAETHENLMVATIADALIPVMSLLGSYFFLNRITTQHTSVITTDKYEELSTQEYSMFDKLIRLADEAAQLTEKQRENENLIEFIKHIKYKHIFLNTNKQ